MKKYKYLLTAFLALCIFTVFQTPIYATTQTDSTKKVESYSPDDSRVNLPHPNLVQSENSIDASLFYLAGQITFWASVVVGAIGGAASIPQFIQNESNPFTSVSQVMTGPNNSPFAYLSVLVAAGFVAFMLPFLFLFSGSPYFFTGQIEQGWAITFYTSGALVLGFLLSLLISPTTLIPLWLSVSVLISLGVFAFGLLDVLGWVGEREKKLFNFPTPQKKSKPTP